MMPSDLAHAFKESGSTETIATKEEFKLSPTKGEIVTLIAQFGR